MKRRVVAAGVALVGVGLVNLPPAWGDDIVAPEGSTPVVGMAYLSTTDSLWLAGPGAADGVLVNSANGATVRFGGEPVSIQALASYGEWLWAADIGDPEASREFVTVFRLNSVAGETSQYQSYDFSYEDGPHHAQAMAISGRGRIYLITAGENPGIYRAELEPSRERVNVLTRVADAPTGVTDAVFLPDGSTLALRSAQGVEIFDAWTWNKLRTQTIIGAAEGESIAADTNGQLFVGGNPSIRQGSVPAVDETITVATPEPSPSDSATPSPSGSASADTTEGASEDTAAPAQTGTLIALSLAGVVALVAGAAVFLIKK